MRLVKGTSLDAKRLKEIHISAYQKSYRGYLPDEYLDSLSITEEVVQKTALYIEKTECYFVEENDEKIAFAYLLDETGEKDVFELMAIYVHPDFQRQGVGRFFVSELIKIKKQKGFKKVILWTIKDGPAVGFYEKIGFKLDKAKESKFWKFNVPIVLFEKNFSE